MENVRNEQAFHSEYRLRRKVDFVHSAWFWAASAFCFIAVFDVFLIFQNVYLIRYAPIFTILLITFVSLYSNINHFQFKKPTAYIFFIVLAFLISFPGALYNKTLTSNSTNMLSLATNMLLPITAFLIPIERFSFSPSRIINILFWLAIFYVVISSLVLIGMKYDIPLIRNNIHSRGFLLPLVFFPFLIERKWIASVVFLCIATVFVYFSAKTTMFIILATSVLFLFTARLLSRTFGTFLLICFIVIFVSVSIFSTVYFSEIEAEFKAAIGGGSNTLARIYLWNMAIQDFMAFPALGDFFTGKSTYLVELGSWEGGLQAYDRPVHNDVLLLLARGGAVGAGIYFAAFLGTLAGAMKNYRTSLRLKNKEMARLNLILASALMSSFIAFTFNPILTSFEAGWLFYFVLALIVISHRYIQRMKT